MKKSLLALAAFAAITSANAQTTYNYFDPADCDANGWLWFDTQEKLEKYCGFDDTFKIQLLTATYENADMEYGEPTLDATIKGYNAAGVEGGEGAKIGAISLYPGKKQGSMSPDGAGIQMHLPDLAEFSLYLSTKEAPLYLGLRGGKGWIEPVDWIEIKTYCYAFFLDIPLINANAYEWNNIQDLQNGDQNFELKSPKGEKVTAGIINNEADPLLIQGIRVFTYSDPNAAGSGVADVEIADQNAPVEYYNLQGIRVANPENGMFIRRQGSKTEKVIL